MAGVPPGQTEIVSSRSLDEGPSDGRVHLAGDGVDSLDAHIGRAGSLPCIAP